MLRHQARPKSQPPIKFGTTRTSNILQSSEWLQQSSSLAKFSKQQVSEDTNQEGKLTSANKQPARHLAELAELSSASSSSNSSLASSSLSLSTNSSTSTVLNTLQLTNTRLTTAQQQLSDKSPVVGKIRSDEPALTSDEDEANQTLSSASSSTSSSSGLSSMNSQNTTTAADHTQQISDEVGRCLSDLVASVASSVSDEKEYKSFKLNEVVLAETRSSTTATSSSESSGEDEQVHEGVESSLSVLPLASSDARQPVEVTPVAGARLVIRFALTAAQAECRSELVQLARRQVNAALVELGKDKCSLKQLVWLVALHKDEQAVEWRRLDTTSGPATGDRRSRSGRMEFNQILNCLVDRQIVVWLCETKIRSAELETTLDDIAFALDELPTKQSSKQYEALVWLCSKETEAKMFGDIYKSDMRQLAKIEHKLEQEKLTKPTPQIVSPEKVAQSVGAPQQKSPKAPAVTCNGQVATNNAKKKDGDETRLSNAEVGGKSRGVKKAVSGSDLSSIPTATTTGGGLASYYRSVASKVISNGQSRIKSFKDEMIRLNRSSSSSNTSLASKRISMLGNQSSGVQSKALSGSALNLSTLAAATTTTTKQIKSSNHHQLVKKSSSTHQLATITSDGHQLRAAQSASLRKLSSSSSKIGSSIDSIPKGVESNANQPSSAPAIKPRTSILKSKQQNNGCDIDNNRQHCTATTNSSARQSCVLSSKQRQVSSDSLKSTVSSTSTAQNKKSSQPKSILKQPSKSVSNSNISQQAQTLDKNNNFSSEPQDSYLCSKQTNNGQRESVTCGQRDKIRSQQVEDGLPAAGDLGDDVALEDDSIVREKAFERIRQRASCYDISRLMSKNSTLQTQLSKLRPGSTCCSVAAGKSRQRRPALLIQDEQELPSVVSDNQAEGEEDETSTIVIHKGEPDGTVRAQVTPAAVVGRRQMRESAALQQNARNELDADSKQRVTVTRPQSEFDPRSLRHLPARELKAQLQLEAAKVERHQQQQAGNSNKTSARRKSLTGIKLLREASKAEEEQFATKQKVRVQKEKDDWVADEDEREQETAANVIEEEEDDEDTETIKDEDEDEEEEDSPVAAETKPAVAETSVKNSPLSKFSLLRQSFNQKTLSSMLKFSGRASMRVKSSVAQAVTHTPNTTNNTTGKPADDKTSGDSKASAIAIAEANLLAAKQLKQQAQRLKEQQKRELQQQQQVAALDPASIMLAAVQYNQQLQRQQQQHHHQQQQQMQVYQQYYRSQQMYDATAMHHHQQQLMYQRQQQQQQQQQQLAYLSSAHYMAQQMALPQLAAPVPYSLAPPVAHQLVGQPVPMQPAMIAQPPHQQHFRSKSILKSSQAANEHQQLMYQVAAAPQLSVNHHSSFNIVYAPNAPAVAQQQEAAPQPAAAGAPAIASSKHSSLGASMRKTVKSILINSRSSQQQRQPAQDASLPAIKGAPVTLKSALKRQQPAQQVLNSEGSEGDGSSSDSTTVGSSERAPIKPIAAPKSALKKSSTSQRQTSASSDSSYSSSDTIEGFHQVSRSAGSATKKSATLARGQDYRQSIKVASSSQGAHDKYYTLRGTKRVGNAPPSNNGRKNVTFSTKLTSIL